jgi:hypothetical protein
LFKHGYPSLFAVSFAGLRDPAKFAQCSQACVAGRHAAAQVVFRGQSDVGPQFLVKIGIQPAVQKEP